MPSLRSLPSVSRPVVLAIIAMLSVVAALIVVRAQTATPEPPPGALNSVAGPGATPAAGLVPLKPTARAGEAAPGNNPSPPTVGAPHATDSPRVKTHKVGEPASLPRPVELALRRHKVVVLFLGQRKSADDAATRAGVRAARSQTKATVFIDSVDNVDAYARIIPSLTISQVPAIVIVGRNRNAQLLEGFIDKETLLQRIRDAS